MGKLWQAGDGIDYPNLNSPVVFDARVSASASAITGTSYPTVTEALAAGKRSIFVDAGTYAAGFTVSIDNVLICCANPRGYDAGFSSVKFGGTITVSASFVEIVRAHVVNSASYGFRVDAGRSGVRLVDCVAYQSALAGFYIHYPGASSFGSYDNVASGCHAVDCGGTLYDGWYFGDVDLDMEWSLNDCFATSSGRDGFQVCHNAVAATSVNRLAKLVNCHASSNGVYGLRCGGRASVQVVGGNYRNNGVSASAAGIYLATQENQGARSQIIGARVRYNAGNGVQLGALTSSQILLGVQAYGNSLANFVNAANCPGYTGTNTNNNGV